MNLTIKNLAGFLCLPFLFGAMGCSTPSAVELITEDRLALGQLTASGKPALSAVQIVDRAQNNGRLREISENLPVFSYTRKVTTTKPGNKKVTANQKTKTYKAYTNNRDQALIKINDRDPTEKETEKDRKESLKHQRQFLKRNDKKGSEKVMTNNMDRYREKFIPRLIGAELVGNRPAYLIQLVPDPNHELKNPTADRIMNQMLVKLWIDQQEFQVSKMEAKTVAPIKIAAGIIGSINSIHVRLEQKRLTPEIWTDHKVEAVFDVRIIIANFTYKVTSQSSGFKLVTVKIHD
tara:strand:+ start:396 stop:1271 length:876 start_codon:yes stop_codon:yes gene_type:complete